MNKLLKKKTFEWAKLVNVRCKNITGCTSDLNYYYSAEEAFARRNEMFELYKNSDKYQIEKNSSKTHGSQHGIGTLYS